MSTLLAKIALILPALWVGSAAAVPLPFSAHGEQNIDTHQIGFSDVTVSQGGLASIVTRFSNGKKISGNNFFAVTYFRDSKGGTLAAFVQWKGLNASFGGHAREATVSDKVQLEPSMVLRLDHVDFRFGVKNCGFQMTGLVLADGDPNNGATFSTVECGNQPSR